MRKVSWMKILFYSALYFAIVFGSIKLFKKDDYQYRLSVIAIFQNEGRFLKEWLDFYRVQGVEHFYLFNNLSDDNYQQILKPYIAAGLVELYDWPYLSKPGDVSDWTKIQSAAYRKGIGIATGRSKWVAFVDTDEFMFTRHKQTLSKFLEDYSECSGILVNWQVFGTGNISRIPDGQMMIEALVMQAPARADINKTCKSIVRPETVKYCNEPSCMIHYPWTYSVDPDKNIFPSSVHCSRPVNIEKIRVNHYWSRDEEFFNTNKLTRSENWGDNKQICLQKNEEANQVLNTDILDWVPLIQQLQKKGSVEAL